MTLSFTLSEGFADNKIRDEDLPHFFYSATTIVINKLRSIV
jgi:hypothetical protein